MQAIEIQADVDQNHEVHFTLPDSWQSDKVKLIVLEDTDSSKLINKREFGGLEGKIHIADDFDEELADSFWLGKDE